MLRCGARGPKRNIARKPLLANRARDLGALQVWACLALCKVYEGGGGRRPRTARSSPTHGYWRLAHMGCARGLPVALWASGGSSKHDMDP